MAVAAAAGMWGRSHFYDAVTAEAAPTAARQQGAPAGGGKPGVPVRVAEVKTATMPITRRTIGWVEPIATVEVKSRIASVIMEQRATEGQFVEAGDILFVLDDREAKAAIAQEEATLKKDQALLDLAQANLDRAQQLAAKQTVSKQSLDQAKSEARAAEAAVTADRAIVEANKLTLSYTVIKAPISGRLGAIPVTPGNLVGENDATALVKITQMKPIRVTFTLPDRDLDQLRTALFNDPPATVRVFTKGETEARAEGRLNFIDSAVDINSGTITAKAEFANDKLELWPGQYFDVEIELGRRDNTPSIPTVALQVGQNGLFVFVVKDDNTVEMRNVTTAGSKGEMSSIASGLQAGERVVIDGQHQLAPGATVAVEGAVE
ncbi:MAG TPA: efflux RND transporter periplasmic adaptor subunit [Dongiaceae bacterium]|nr:efflux RND transporter periplasmic adaptor subunit [Dongiaceae bacterium]